MKKKKYLKFIPPLIVVIIAIVILLQKKDYNTIPDDYICVFHGGSGEMTHETYIYKDDDGKDNYGFDYINTTSNTLSWGSSEWVTKVTKKGKAGWSDEVFKVARENGAYDYVEMKGRQEKFTIEEFQTMFIMN